MPEFWMPAWVRVEAPTRQAALDEIESMWPTEDYDAPIDGAVYVRVTADDAALAEGDLLADEQARADYIATWGFGPPVATPRAQEVRHD